jgi:hypothetical protein
MEIKPTYVTFEQAKLLKEKGFNFRTNTAFYPNGEISNYYPYDNLGENNSYFWRPEQWQVIEWLRIKHNIVIVPDLTHINKFGYRIIWESKNKALEERVSYTYKFISPQEAYSAAFDYILNKLI